MLKKSIAVLLTFALLLGVFAAAPFSAGAAENTETAMVGASSGTTGASYIQSHIFPHKIVECVVHQKSKLIALYQFYLLPICE